MRAHSFLIIGALTAGLASSATAQDKSGTTTTTTTTTTVTTSQSTNTFGDNPSYWLASGFVGSDFGAQSTGSSVEFGGTVGYLYRGWVGPEFLADFTPDFQLLHGAILPGKPQVNSYMVNAIGAVPLGAEGRFSPYVSGGVGAITLRSDPLTLADNTQAVRADDSHLAGNIGLGLMTYAGNWGVRADVRYFRSVNDKTGTSTTASGIASGLLDGLDFWRANIGIAVKW